MEEKTVEVFSATISSSLSVGTANSINLKCRSIWSSNCGKYQDFLEYIPFTMNFEHAHISTGAAKGTVLKGTHYSAVLEYNPLFMWNLVQIT